MSDVDSKSNVQPPVLAPQDAPVSSVLFESFREVPVAWHDVWQSDDLGMDPRVLSVFQRTLAADFRCWGVIVFDASGAAIGCAALALFPVELIESANPAIVRWRERLRRLWRGAGKMNVLFCGLPVPAGTMHLRVRPGAPVETVVAEVDRVMRRLARRVQGRLIIFKEIGADAAPVSAALSGLGYVRGAIVPVHRLAGSFANFADYCGALKSRYRSQIQRSQKKLAAGGFEVLSGRGGAFVAAHFDEEVHRLYVAVQERAEQKLELMPASFFREMAVELGDEVVLTLIRRAGRVCAFTYAITRGGTHHNLYSGLDYALNPEGDLYFNLFYLDLNEAFRGGAKLVTMGQTSDAFKSRLGTNARTLSFFARTASPAFDGLLRLLAPVAFPKVPKVEPNDVFATTGGRD